MFTKQEQEDEIRRILQPPVGQTPNQVGERDPDEQAARGRASLSLALTKNPDLFYEIHRDAAQGAKDLLLSFSELLLKLTDLLRDAGRQSKFSLSEDTLLRLKAQSATLASSLATDLVSSPVYQQWRKESERLLREELSSAISGSTVTLHPTEVKRAGAEIAIVLEKGVAELESRIALLGNALTSFSAAPVQRDILRHLLSTVDREVGIVQSNLQQYGAVSVGPSALTLLSARAAAKSLETRRQLRRYLAVDADVGAQAISEVYPGSPPQFETNSAGPYHLPSARSLRILHRGRLATILVGPSTTPTLFSTLPESYTWVSSVTGSAGPFVFVTPKTLELYLEANGVRYDASVTIAAGSFTDAELCTLLNTAWQQMSLDGFVEATGTITINGLAGTLLAVGTGSANSLLGLEETGGFLLTDPGVAELLSSNTEPYVFAADASFLMLGTSPEGTVPVEVGIAAGTYSATAISTFINQRFSILGVSFLSSVSSGKVELSSPAENYILTIPASSGAVVLGFTPGSSVQGTVSRRTLDLRINGNPASATLPAGRYSATSLAAALDTALGAAHVNTTPVGAPGSRTLALAYEWIDSGTSTLQCLGTSMGTYLRVPTLARSAVRMSASLLAGRMQEQTDLIRVRSVLLDPVACTVSSVRSRFTSLRLYAREGSAQISSPAPDTAVLERAEGWEGVLPGHLLVLTSDPYTDTAWTVDSVAGTTLTCSGTGSPVPGTVFWIAGPALPSLIDAAVRIDGGPLNGEHLVITQTRPLEVETRSTFLGEFSAYGTYGFLGVQIEGTAASELVCEADISFSDLFDATDNTLPFRRVEPPTTQWLRLTSPVAGAVPGDLWKGRSRGSESSFALLHNALITEIEEDGLVIRTDREVTPAFTATLSTGSALDAYYVIESQRYVRHADAEALLRPWQADTVTRRRLTQQMKVAVFAALQRVNPTPGQVALALLAMQAFQDHLLYLESPLDSLLLTEETPLLQELKKELARRGMTRTLDLLGLADFASAFDLTQSVDRSYHALTSLRELAAEIGRSTEEEEDPSTQIDYADAEEEFAEPEEDAQETSYE